MLPLTFMEVALRMSRFRLPARVLAGIRSTTAGYLGAHWPKDYGGGG